jgi:lipopolysaccharide/colanic/teichoic acid biosynthesis glycosyltransferase
MKPPRQTNPSVRPSGLTGKSARYKAYFDRVASSALLAVLSPLMAATALIVRLDSRGPILYRQQRAGQHGRLFQVFKFRTMVNGAEYIGLGKEVAKDDERITRIGKWLRVTSFDEVPQLVNVLLGQMSLVGPRPTTVDQVERYSTRQRRRLEAKPGLTGWAQVNGRNALTWQERIERDIWYVDHWSFPLDLRILLRTPFALVDQEGIYGAGGVTRDFEET